MTPRSVRSALALRPSRPMMRPASPGAAVSSMTVVSPPATSLTCTDSGRSARLRATYSTSSLAVTGSAPARSRPMVAGAPAGCSERARPTAWHAACSAGGPGGADGASARPPVPAAPLGGDDRAGRRPDELPPHLPPLRGAEGHAALRDELGLPAGAAGEP